MIYAKQTIPLSWKYTGGMSSPEMNYPATKAEKECKEAVSIKLLTIQISNGEKGGGLIENWEMT